MRTLDQRNTNHINSLNDPTVLRRRGKLMNMISTRTPPEYAAISHLPVVDPLGYIFQRIIFGKLIRITYGEPWDLGVSTSEWKMIGFELEFLYHPTSEC